MILITNHRPLVPICITLPVESASFFIPSLFTYSPTGSSYLAHITSPQNLFYSHHLSLLQPFTPDLKPIHSTNTFLYHGLRTWTVGLLACTGHWRLFVLVSSFEVLFLDTCAGLSWPHYMFFQSTLLYRIVSYWMVVVSDRLCRLSETCLSLWQSELLPNYSDATYWYYRTTDLTA